MNVMYEVWIRTQRNETVKGFVEAADVPDALDAGIKRFKLDRSEVKECRVKESTK